MVVAILVTWSQLLPMPYGVSGVIPSYYSWHFPLGSYKTPNAFLGEFTNLLAISALFSVLFLGSSPFSVVGIAAMLFMLLFIFVIRATLSRIRFDSLLSFGWKGLLPFTASYSLLTIALVLLY